MKVSNTLVITASVCLLYSFSSAGDDKKHMTVRAGTSAQQVNNHPWSYTTPGHGNTNCSEQWNRQRDVH